MYSSRIGHSNDIVYARSQPEHWCFRPDSADGLSDQMQLGVSPTQYLVLRGMHAVRRSLLKGDPAMARVTTIATEHGFWELGRFAHKYRQIFGETPSKTQNSPSEDN